MIQVYIIYLAKLSTRDENFGQNVRGQTVLAKLSMAKLSATSRDYLLYTEMREIIMNDLLSSVRISSMGFHCYNRSIIYYLLNYCKLVKQLYISSQWPCKKFILVVLRCNHNPHTCSFPGEEPYTTVAWSWAMPVTSSHCRNSVPG